MSEIFICIFCGGLRADRIGSVRLSLRRSGDQQGFIKRVTKCACREDIAPQIAGDHEVIRNTSFSIRDRAHPVQCNGDDSVITSEHGRALEIDEGGLPIVMVQHIAGRFGLNLVGHAFSPQNQLSGAHLSVQFGPESIDGVQGLSGVDAGEDAGRRA